MSECPRQMNAFCICRFTVGKGSKTELDYTIARGRQSPAPHDYGNSSNIALRTSQYMWVELSTSIERRVGERTVTEWDQQRVTQLSVLTRCCSFLCAGARRWEATSQRHEARRLRIWQGEAKQTSQVGMKREGGERERVVPQSLLSFPHTNSRAEKERERKRSAVAKVQ